MTTVAASQNGLTHRYQKPIHETKLLFWRGEVPTASRACLLVSRTGRMPTQTRHPFACLHSRLAFVRTFRQRLGIAVQSPVLWRWRMWTAMAIWTSSLAEG